MEDVDQLIEAINVALAAGEWAQVSRLTMDLYALAEAEGDQALVELVQDLHWIANDALAYPHIGEQVLAP